MKPLCEKVREKHREGYLLAVDYDLESFTTLPCCYANTA